MANIDFTKYSPRIKPIFDKIMKAYLEGSDSINDLLYYGCKAENLTIGECFDLYVLLTYHCDGDRFFRCIGENSGDLDYNGVPDFLEEL